MNLVSSGRSKVAVQIAATVAAVLFWGFAVEYVLQTFVFVSPLAVSIRQVE